MNLTIVFGMFVLRNFLVSGWMSTVSKAFDISEDVVTVLSVFKG